jgi:hypothetical protein
VSRYVTLCLLSAGATPPMVSLLILKSILEIKIEESQLLRAPLRNRTVDLLLTMHAGSVCCRRIRSDNRSSEGSQCLGRSRYVGRYLEPLSLASSLTDPITSYLRSTGSMVMVNTGHDRRDHSATIGDSGFGTGMPSSSGRRPSRSVPRTGKSGFLGVFVHLTWR